MDPLGSIPKNTVTVEGRKGRGKGEWRGCYTREGRSEWRGCYESRVVVGVRGKIEGREEERCLDCATK